MKNYKQLLLLRNSNDQQIYNLLVGGLILQDIREGKKIARQSKLEAYQCPLLPSLVLDHQRPPHQHRSRLRPPAQSGSGGD